MPFEFNFDINFPLQLQGIWATVSLRDFLDIFIVAAILYKVYEMLQDTRAITLVKGLLVLMTVTVICNFFQLHVISWLLQKSLTLIFVALPIVFQPELRRALEHLGQGGFIGKSVLLDDKEAAAVVNELVKAVKSLAASKTGALLVIERKMGLNDISMTGVRIEGLISSEFLLNVFIVNTPLHDGAAIIRGKRLVAAGCLLPLTEDRSLDKELGTRHRAAIGLSEQSDALIVVVSEETGTISVAEGGHLMRRFDEKTLAAKIRPAFVGKENKIFGKFLSKWREKK